MILKNLRTRHLKKLKRRLDEAEFLDRLKDIRELRYSAEIAKFLNTRGVRGFIKNEYTCPIAQYLSHGASVRHGNIYFAGQYYCITGAMDTFISFFDEGYYPELIQREGD